MFNPAIARMTHVNITVILLTALSLQLVAPGVASNQVGGDSVPVDLEQLRRSSDGPREHAELIRNPKIRNSKQIRSRERKKIGNQERKRMWRCGVCYFRPSDVLICFDFRFSSFGFVSSCPPSESTMRRDVISAYAPVPAHREAGSSSPPPSGDGEPGRICADVAGSRDHRHFELRVGGPGAGDDPLAGRGKAPECARFQSASRRVQSTYAPAAREALDPVGRSTSTASPGRCSPAASATVFCGRISSGADHSQAAALSSESTDFVIMFGVGVLHAPPERCAGAVLETSGQIALDNILVIIAETIWDDPGRRLG